MTLTEFVIKRPSVVIVAIAVLAIFGVISYVSLSSELLPKFNVPTLTIITPYPGASPAEVESEVSKEIEDRISTLENVKRIRSSSYENLSVVILELNNGIDVDDALSKAQRKLSGIESLLPEDANSPTVSKISSDDFPILKYSLSSDIPSNTAFYQFVEDKIVPQFSSTQGVASVELVGGEERAIRVMVDETKLKANNISLLMVNQAIDQNNVNFPTGKVESEESGLRIQLSGKFQNIEDIEELVITKLPNGSKVRIRDVAAVIDGKKDVKTISRINGQAAISLNITKQSDANAVDIAEIIKEQVTELESRYSDRDFKMALNVDSTDFTIAAIEAVQHDLVIALLLVAFVMLVFLHSLRDSLIVMMAIPCSFLGTIIVMYLFGFTLNLMTLLALTVVIGILVDDSIVVLENIHRHLGMGKDKVKASVDGRSEIGFTAIAITSVDIVVFLPLALTNAGVVSTILSQFSWVIVTATLFSLIVSFTVTPWLSSRYATLIDLNKNHWWNRMHKAIEDQITALSEWYVSVLRWVLTHKSITIVSIFTIFLASLLLVTRGYIGNAFIEQGDRGEVVFYLETAKTSTLEYTDSITRIVEEQFMEMPEVATVLATVGVSGSGQEAGGLSAYKSELTVQLKDGAEIGDEAFAKQSKNRFSDIPGVELRDALISINGAPDTAPIQLIVSASDRTTVLEYGEKVETILLHTPGVTNINKSIEAGVPEINVSLDKEKMADLGLNVFNVGATMATAFGGNDASSYTDNGVEYDIVVQLQKFDRRNAEDVGSLSFVNNQGELIRLDQFADISLSTASNQLERTDRIPSVLVEASLRGRQIGDVSSEIDQAIASADFPSSINVTWIGTNASQSDSFAAIAGAFGLSLVLIYLLMILLYDNYIYPLVVLIAIPMSFVGAFLVLALTKSALSIFTLMGMVVMMGLVSKNAILIVDFTNQAKAEGKNSFDALLEAGRERLRPIMMTTFSMVIGLLPVALASGAGAAWKNGLGWALVGGLTSSMCLTVFIVPAVYLIVDIIKERTAGKSKHKVHPKRPVTSA